MTAGLRGPCATAVFVEFSPRQSLRDARGAVSGGAPLHFHTFDESNPLPSSQGKCHIVDFRTESDLSAGAIARVFGLYLRLVPGER